MSFARTLSPPLGTTSVLPAKLGADRARRRAAVRPPRGARARRGRASAQSRVMYSTNGRGSGGRCAPAQIQCSLSGLLLGDVGLGIRRLSSGGHLTNVPAGSRAGPPRPARRGGERRAATARLRPILCAPRRADLGADRGSLARSRVAARRTRRRRRRRRRTPSSCRVGAPGAPRAAVPRDAPTTTSPPATLRQVPKRSQQDRWYRVARLNRCSAGNTPDGAPSAPSSWASSSGWPASCCTSPRTPRRSEPPYPGSPALPGIPNGPDARLQPDRHDDQTWVCGFNALSTHVLRGERRQGGHLPGGLERLRPRRSSRSARRGAGQRQRAGPHSGRDELPDRQGAQDDERAAPASSACASRSRCRTATPGPASPACRDDDHPPISTTSSTSSTATPTTLSGHGSPEFTTSTRYYPTTLAKAIETPLEISPNKVILESSLLAAVLAAVLSAGALGSIWAAEGGEGRGGGGRRASAGEGGRPAAATPDGTARADAAARGTRARPRRPTPRPAPSAGRRRCRRRARDEPFRGPALGRRPPRRWGVSERRRRRRGHPRPADRRASTPRRSPRPVTSAARSRRLGASRFMGHRRRRRALEARAGARRAGSRRWSRASIVDGGYLRAMLGNVYFAPARRRARARRRGRASTTSGLAVPPALTLTLVVARARRRSTRSRGSPRSRASRSSRSSRATSFGSHMVTAPPGEQTLVYTADRAVRPRRAVVRRRQGARIGSVRCASRPQRLARASCGPSGSSTTRERDRRHARHLARRVADADAHGQRTPGAVRHASRTTCSPSRSSRSSPSLARCALQETADATTSRPTADARGPPRPRRARRRLALVFWAVRGAFAPRWCCGSSSASAG